jgi:hypothetical protein
MIICKVCGGKVSDEVACCARCFTPHHFDCWSFTGACSIYACGSREHRYFDFREKGESEVLAAISQSLALALSTGGSPEAPAPTAPAHPARPKDAADDVRRSHAELLAHISSQYRFLHARIAKEAPGRRPEDEIDAGSLEAELAGGEPGVPRLFLADDLPIDEPAPRAGQDLPDEKRELLHSLARATDLPARTGASDLIADLLRPIVAWLRRLFARRR